MYTYERLKKKKGSSIFLLNSKAKVTQNSENQRDGG